jgi:histone acetyltransferase (RNA polymerase elongator complex component)
MSRDPGITNAQPARSIFPTFNNPMPPLVIPIFISHQGCPHRCIFCDQFTIAGSAENSQPASGTTVRTIIEQWLNRPRKEDKESVQVAFYGGSFTGISVKRQEELLGAVKPYIDDGRVNAVRISTRPDYIDDSVLALLLAHSVSIVELGLQSLDQGVLDCSARGHTALQSENAMRLLRERGFTVGAQLMCGLPGDSTGKLMATARRVAALAPDFVRIYPALVISGSGLEELYRANAYRPLSLSKAIALVSRMKRIFVQHDIKVVRMGLQPSQELEARVLAGPYHPAFGELVNSRGLFLQARQLLRSAGKRRINRVSVSAADESAFRGPDNVNIRRLNALGLLHGVELIFDREQPRSNILAY